MRLYRRSAADKLKFQEYHGPREGNALKQFLSSQAQTVVTAKDAHYHRQSAAGCRLHGFVNVARVPGTLHIEAKHTTDKSINYAYVNTSHTVNSFSFGEESPEKYKHLLPAE